MTLFSKVFSTRTLLQIVCVLTATIIMKGLHDAAVGPKPRLLTLGPCLLFCLKARSEI